MNYLSNSRYTFSRYIRKERLDKQGKTMIYFRLTKDRIIGKISTNIKVEPKYWNANKEEVKVNHPNHYRINNALFEMEEKVRSKINLILSKNISISITEAISQLNEKNEEKQIEKTDSIKDFYSLADEIIKEYNFNNKIGTRDKAKGIINKLKRYYKKKSLKLSDINYSFLKTYEMHCKVDLKNKQNTISKDMKFIKQVINRAVKMGIIESKESPFLNYKIKEQKSSRTYLTQEELNTIVELDLGYRTNLSIHRDIFVFACYSGGLRISDVLLLRWEDISNNRLAINFKKTGHQTSIALNNTSIDILNRYKPFKQKYIFGMLPDWLESSLYEEVDKSITRATTLINRSLKVIAIKAKINKRLSTHIARHTFATLALSKNIRLDILQQILGHSNIRETQIYAKTISKEVDIAISNFDIE